ncbi:sensor domain-containing diguanylate cyclase [Shewanella pneumatophori]|uniref:diguanylate cyclase n=1 Tax=Shewanella pneumatophori TaxID=314092 RepID=A0A9X1ZDE4_9GAMM|nr:sensor domain-containing diguanylate cyclase [Shewanella pneumatophori]MCL1140204.1 sensor domain-containing diguanylate cyclase [Shewanella pneumatophori]
MTPIKDSLKKKKIDSLDLKTHLALLGAPMLLLLIVWAVFFSISNNPNSVANLVLVAIIYLLGYSLSYYFHQGRLNRLWEHLQQVIHVNDTTFELVNIANQYQDERAFLDALLKKAVSSIDGAEMGSIIKVDSQSGELHFESTIGIDIEKLRSVQFNLKQSFEYKLTKGKCDRVVVIDDMANINAHSSLSTTEQQVFLSAPLYPIRSTLSSPIHIDGALYGMLNLDSATAKAFSHYDRNLVAILTHEAANAIALYQKTRQINLLANYDSLTELYNRQRFEQGVKQWKIKPHFGSYLIVLDLDNLKVINDNYGHLVGDKAIQTFATALKQIWHQKHLIARYGGDEFIALCHGPQAQIEADLQQLQQTLFSQQMAISNPGSQTETLSTENISFSYGIANYQGHLDASFRVADKMMYQNKRRKQNSTE